MKKKKFPQIRTHTSYVKSHARTVKIPTTQRLKIHCTTTNNNKGITALKTQKNYNNLNINEGLYIKTNPNSINLKIETNNISNTCNNTTK